MARDRAELLEAIFAQPDNAAVVEHLGATRDSYFTVGDPSPFDEGGTLFARWSHRVPDDCRCTLGIVNLLVHERTARIFALHHGRLTIAIRSGRDGRLGGETMDGAVDLRALGPGWGLYERDDGDDADDDDAFVCAYRLAGA